MQLWEALLERKALHRAEKHADRPEAHEVYWKKPKKLRPSGTSCYKLLKVHKAANVATASRNMCHGGRLISLFLGENGNARVLEKAQVTC